MRFEVRYPEGVPHEVELQGSLVVVGRDPGADLVLHDVKCSRRHAVLEAGPDGISVRDTASANGVYLNGGKVERAQLNPGDVLRLGDTLLKLLPEEDVPGTVVMGPGEIEAGEATIGDATMVPPRRPAGTRPVAPRRPPAPAAQQPARVALPEGSGEAPSPAASGPRRPLTVNVLSALWLMSVPIYGLGGLALALGSKGFAAALWGALGLLLAALSGLLAWALWSLRPWARVAQIAVAALGVLFCPFTLASIVVLVYMLTPAGAAAFDASQPQSGQAPGAHETAFAATLLGTVLLGGLLTGLGLLLPHVATRLS